MIRIRFCGYDLSPAGNGADTPVFSVAKRHGDYLLFPSTLARYSRAACLSIADSAPLPDRIENYGDGMRIAFIGDTHFCLPRESDVCREGLDYLPDHIRYTPMAKTVMAPLFRAVKATMPDLVISSGDVVEGGWRGDADRERRELRESLGWFQDLSAPFLVARGTHDARAAFADIFLPAMAAGSRSGKTYFRHDQGACTFLVLDYQDFAAGSEQERWCEEMLADARDRRVFVIAHAPVYLWGRHFFGDPDLIRRLDELFAAYAVEAFLCGHTHNQAVSLHRRGRTRGWLQIMASSVGYPHMPCRPLKQVHALAEYGPGDRFLWGTVEDSAPGFYLLEVDDGLRRLSWHSVAGEKRCWAFGENSALSAEACAAAAETTFTAADCDQIKAATLGVFSYTGAEPAGLVRLHNHSLGALPVNPSYAARRFLPVPRAALPRIGARNRLTIALPELAEFSLGSLVLECTLLDGRVMRSLVGSEIFVCGERWREFPGRRHLVEVKPGQVVEVEIRFPFS
jgi:3',5'-cyclic AMP phosphodiesterase CpdA